MADLDVGMAVGLIKALGSPDPTVIEGAVADWLDDHPEATTTVQDGSITKAKLDSNLQGTVDDVAELKSEITNNYQGFDETYTASGTVNAYFEFLKGKTYRFSLIASSGAAAINIYNEVGGSSVESVGTLNAGSYIDYTVQTGGNCVHFYHNSAGHVTIENIDSLIYKSIEYKDNEIKSLFDYYSTMKPTTPTFEAGTFNPSTGQPSGSTTRARTVDYFEIDPVTSFIEVTGINAYTGGTLISILFYDSSQGFLGETGWIETINVGATRRYKISNQNASYIKINTRSSNSATITSTILSQLGSGAIKVFNRAEDSETTKLGELVSYNDVKINAISHRGWHTDPENTLIAFKDSKKHGFDFVEGDVRFTSDGVAVMLHDESINRTARNADGTSISSTINIADITYEQSQTYDFGIYKGSQFAGTKIPTFREFIILCKNIGITPYIELKMPYGTASSVITPLVDIVKQCGMLDSVVWVCSTASVLQAVPNYYSKAKCGLYVETITQERITVCGDLKTSSNEVFMSANYTNVTDELINLCITNNMPLEIFVCDSASYIESMNPYITGVLSNTLDARKVLYDKNI